jgi:hypothetical protein
VGIAGPSFRKTVPTTIPTGVIIKTSNRKKYTFVTQGKIQDKNARELVLETVSKNQK